MCLGEWWAAGASKGLQKSKMQQISNKSTNSIYQMLNPSKIGFTFALSKDTLVIIQEKLLKISKFHEELVLYGNEGEKLEIKD
jgi:hypothetical protein